MLNGDIIAAFERHHIQDLCSGIVPRKYSKTEPHHPVAPSEFWLQSIYNFRVSRRSRAPCRPHTRPALHTTPPGRGQTIPFRAMAFIAGPQRRSPAVPEWSPAPRRTLVRAANCGVSARGEQMSLDKSWRDRPPGVTRSSLCPIAGRTSQSPAADSARSAAPTRDGWREARSAAIAGVGHERRGPMIASACTPPAAASLAHANAALASHLQDP